VVILDGALATELERHGADLSDPLWSAKCLLEQPELIRKVHLDYFRAGAQVATTATYQATFAGFAKRGIEHAVRARGAEAQRHFDRAHALARWIPGFASRRALFSPVLRSFAPALRADAATWPVDDLWLVGHRALRDVPRVAAVWAFMTAMFRA